jgi:hypothetical protein
MKAFFAVVFVLALSSTALAKDSDIQYPATLNLADGTHVTPTKECGVGDPCATVAWPNGDKTTFYSLGAAYCQPFTVRMVRTSKTGAVILQSDVSLASDKSQSTLAAALTGSDTNATNCNKATNGTLTLTEGLHVNFFLQKDGNLRAGVWQSP